MKNFKEKMRININDRTAAFVIVLFAIITWVVAFSIVQASNYIKATNAELSLASSEEEISKQMEEQAKAESQIDEDEAQKENEEEYEKLKEENKIDESAADKYYIKVNYGAQVVTIYKKDSNGDYTVPVKAMVCSTGTYTPTSGVYRTLGKGNWWKLIGDVYGQYSTWICGDILFHSVPYLTKGDKSSLEYWAYDQLGSRVSMGCVRLTVEDAKWIYDNCSVGTQVEFYASSNPGPLGKPSTRKISSAPSNIRGWDPTDPDPNNPWPDYLKELEKQEAEEEKKNSDKNSENKNTNTSTENKNNNTVTDTPSTKPEENDVTEEVGNNDIESSAGGNGNNTTGEEVVEPPTENEIDGNIVNGL